MPAAATCVMPTHADVTIPSDLEHALPPPDQADEALALTAGGRTRTCGGATTCTGGPAAAAGGRAVAVPCTCVRLPMSG